MRPDMSAGPTERSFKPVSGFDLGVVSGVWKSVRESDNKAMGMFMVAAHLGLRYAIMLYLPEKL